MAFSYDKFRNFVEGYYKRPDQGIKACKRELKKNPNDPIYLLAQAQLQWQMRNYEEAYSSCLDLKFGDAVPDANLLSETQAIVCQCQHAMQMFNHIAPPQVGAAWKDALDKAIKGKGNSKSVQREMFRAAWRDEYWDLAQQLFARLQREYPSNAHYHFAWIALSQLQADQMPKDDRMAQSLKMLALRSMKTAAENTRNDKDVPRKVMDSHHLRLLSQIYMQQDEKAELLSIFEDPKIGIDSSVGKGDGEFTRLRIQILKEKPKDNASWIVKQTHQQLSQLADAKDKKNNAEIEKLSGANDWFVWDALTEAAFATNDAKQRSELKSLIDRFITLEPKNRNVGRAFLTYHSKTETELLQACIRFFDFHSTKRSCFGDLKDFLPDLTHEEQGNFIDHIDKAAKSSNPFQGDTHLHEGETPKKEHLDWVAININALKFEYFLCVSKAPLPEKESLEQFVSDSLHMYKGALRVSKDCGDELCILAVMGLVKLHHFSRDYDLDDETTSEEKEKNATVSPKAYLIQALMLLECLQSQSPHNYSASLLSVLLGHQSLCLTSVAAESMVPLGIKEVIHDTIAHIFWSRIGITHPFPCMDISTVRENGGNIDQYRVPVRGMASALEWYDAAGDRMMEFMGDKLEEVPFDKIDEFARFKKSVEHSYSHAMILLEARRMARLTGQGLGVVIEPLPTGFGVNIQDNRDWNTIPSFEYEPVTANFGTFVATKPRPGRFWLARQISNDILQTLLVVKSAPRYLLDLLDFNVRFMSEPVNREEVTYQLSSSEQLVSKGWELLEPLILWLSGEKPSSTTTVSPANSRPGTSSAKANKPSSLSTKTPSTPSIKTVSSAHIANSSSASTTSDTRKEPLYKVSQSRISDLATLTNFITDLASTIPSAPEVNKPADLIPSTDVIQALYLRLELLQTLYKFSETLTKLASGKEKADPRAKELADEQRMNKSQFLNKILSELTDSIKKQGEDIKELSKTWISRLNKAGFNGTVVKLLEMGPTGEDVAGIIEVWINQEGNEKIKEERAVEFWGACLDGVEGLGRVKLT